MNTGLQIICDFCKAPIFEPGGLLFTNIPELPDLRKKEHLCRKCSDRVFGILDFTENQGDKGGIYVGPPLDTHSWNVPWKTVSVEDVQKIRKLLE